VHDASPCGRRLTNRLHLLRRNRPAKKGQLSHEKVLLLRVWLASWDSTSLTLRNWRKRLGRICDPMPGLHSSHSSKYRSPHCTCGSDCPSSSTVRELSYRPRHCRAASLNHPHTLQSSAQRSSRGLNLKTIQQKKHPALRLPPLWFPAH